MAKIHFVKAARKFVGKCEKCLRFIDRGESYKWISVKPPGYHEGKKLIRCADCEDWHEWDYNPSVGAQCKRIIHETENHLRWHKSITRESEAERVMRWAATDIRELSRQRSESARQTLFVFGKNNFAHKKLTSEAKALSWWADQCSKWRAPALPEPEPTKCTLCFVKGHDFAMTGDPACPECLGFGIYIPNEPNDEQLRFWRYECADSAMETLQLCPI